MEIAFATGAYDRPWGNFPRLRCENLFIEESEATKLGVALVSRKGFSTHIDHGNGPVSNLFAKDGVFNGDLFTAAANSLYRGSASLGTFPGGGVASIAASPSEIVVTAGDTPYYYNGTSLSAVSTSIQAVSTAFLAGYFVFASKGEDRMYFSGSLDASQTTGFTSAESEADELLDTIRVGDFIMACGAETIQQYRATGDSVRPFATIEGLTYQKGVLNTGCAVAQDNALFFVGNDGACYRGGNVPEKISHHGIDERIKDAGSARAFGWNYDGHAYFGVTTSNGTFVYDVATQRWAEFSRYQASNWEVNCAATVGTTPYFGDASTGEVHKFNEYDDNSDPLVRRFTAALALERPEIINSLELGINAGFGSVSDPLMEMRYSTDGHSFSDWIPTALAAQGNYAQRPYWDGLGFFDKPGVLFDFRVSDAIPFRVDSVFINGEIVNGAGQT